MRLRLQNKLVALMLLAAIGPLGLAGISAVHIAQTTTTTQIREAHLVAAARVAADINRLVESRLWAIERSVDTFTLQTLEPEERVGAMRLVYRQVDGLDIVGAVDARGAPVVAPVSLTQDVERPEALATRGVRDEAARRVFLQHIPIRAALRDGRAVSQPYDIGVTGGPRIALAVRSGDWVVAGELSLAQVQQQLSGLALGQATEAFVVSSDGIVLVDSGGARSGTVVTDHEFLRAHLDSSTPGAEVAHSPFDGQRSLLAFVPVSKTGWGVAVSQPTRHAFVAARTLRWQTLFWIAVSAALAVILGMFYARRLVHPVAALSQGASKFAKGDLGHRIDVETRDEIEDLAAAFNQMAGDLEASINEIERWNEELASRVEARTRELAEAQSDLFQTRKLAAVGELGAGVAHELNNPLTAVVGFANVMLERCAEDDPNRRRIQLIHDAGRRCADIVESLLRFSESVKRGSWDLVDINQAIGDAINVMPQHLRDTKVELETDLQGDLPHVFGAPGEVRTIAYQLLNNAYEAVRGGGTVVITSFLEGDQVCLRVSDNGPGMDPETRERIFEPFFTSERPERKGLGLSIVYGIVRDHDGEIDVDSETGKGTVIHVKLPTADSSKKAKAARLTPSDIGLEEPA